MPELLICRNLDVKMMNEANMRQKKSAVSFLPALFHDDIILCEYKTLWK